MTTKIRHLYPSQEFPAIAVAPDETVPARWLEALVDDARRRILAGAVTKEDEARVMREADSIRVYGAAGLIFVYDDELTSVEIMADDLVALRAQLAAAQARIKELEGNDNGSDIAGTPAAPVGHTWGPSDVLAAAPADRQQVFLNWFTQSGWKLPDHDAPVYFGIRQQGVEYAEAEAWLGLAPGYFAKVQRVRGLVTPA